MSGRGPPDISNLHSLKIDNLAPDVTDQDLRPVFEKFGKIGDVHVPRNRHGNNNENRGFAFVRFYDKHEADDAMRDLDGKDLLGKEMRIQFAKYNRKDPSSFTKSRGGRDRGRDDSRYSRRHSRSRSPRYRRSRSRSPRYRRSRSRSPSSRRRSPSPRRRSPSPRRRSPSPQHRSPRYQADSREHSPPYKGDNPR